MLVVYKLHETQAVPAVKRHYITDNTAFATCNTLQYSKRITLYTPGVLQQFVTERCTCANVRKC